MSGFAGLLAARRGDLLAATFDQNVESLVVFVQPWASRFMLCSCYAAFPILESTSACKRGLGFATRVTFVVLCRFAMIRMPSLCLPICCDADRYP